MCIRDRYQGGRLWCYDADNRDVPMRLPCCHNPFGGSPTATLPHDTKVDKFDGEYYIEEQYHKREQIYWDKYTNICNN